MLREWTALRTLLEHCTKCGTDNLGYIHYIPKELIDDAQREYDLYIRRNQKKAR